MRIALFIDGIHFYRSFGQSQHEIDYDALAQWIVQNIHTQPQNVDFVGGYYYTYDFQQPNLQRFWMVFHVERGSLFKNSSMLDRMILILKRIIP